MNLVVGGLFALVVFFFGSLLAPSQIKGRKITPFDRLCRLLITLAILYLWYILLVAIRWNPYSTNGAWWAFALVFFLLCGCTWYARNRQGRIQKAKDEAAAQAKRDAAAAAQQTTSQPNATTATSQQPSAPQATATAVVGNQPPANAQGLQPPPNNSPGVTIV